MCAKSHHCITDLSLFSHTYDLFSIDIYLIFLPKRVNGGEHSEFFFLNMGRPALNPSYSIF